MPDAIRGALEIIIGILLFAAAIFVIMLVGQLVQPKIALTFMGPVYAWWAYVTRPDILLTAIGVAVAVKYASTAAWLRNLL